jgi:hypothetical protein
MIHLEDHLVAMAASGRRIICTGFCYASSYRIDMQ